jgi:hypothetical protein
MRTRRRRRGCRFRWPLGKLGVSIAVLCASLVLGTSAGQARAEDAAAPAASATPGKTKKSRKARAKQIAPETTPKPVTARKRKVGGSAIYVLGGGTGGHHIDENAPRVEAFPHEEAAAVTKAFAETRREQLVDAEKAARTAKQADRWRTVLFSLRGLDDHIDPEACFWRVLSFYRLGEVERARAVRESCELPSKDSITLNGEDAIASGLPVMGATQEATAGTGGATGQNKTTAGPAAGPAAAPTATPVVAPVAAYSGPSPQRYR